MFMTLLMLLKIKKILLHSKQACILLEIYQFLEENLKDLEENTF